jgi:hypothetical protein
VTTTGIQTVANKSLVGPQIDAGASTTAYINTSGTPTDVPLNIQSKGAGQVALLTGAGPVAAFYLGGTNYFLFNANGDPNNITLTPQTLSQSGNVGINFNPKGSGKVMAHGDEIVTAGRSVELVNKVIDYNKNTLLNFPTTGGGTQVAVPATATSTGVVGQWAADATNAYFCVAANTWRRVALSTW